MQTGSTLVRVAPNPAGGWDIREPGTTRVLSHVARKDDALLRAHAVMLNGGRVQVLDGGGFLIETHDVPGPLDRPRWYIASRPLFWVLGAGFLLQGILGLAEGDLGGFRFWLGLVQVPLGASYLVLIALSRRHDRRLLRTSRRRGTMAG